MIISFDQPCIVTNGVLTFPDFPFNPLPKQPNQIKETILLEGGWNNTVSIEGTTDDVEG